MIKKGICQGVVPYRVMALEWFEVLICEHNYSVIFDLHCSLLLASNSYTVFAAYEIKPL